MDSRNQTLDTNVVEQCLADRMNFFHLRSLFYLVTPSEVIPKTPMNSTLVKNGSEEGIPDFASVPDYFTDTIPIFMVICLVELIANLVITGQGFRLNDTIASWSAGILSHMVKLSMKTVNTAVYVWLFRNFRLTTLPLDTWWAWVAALLATDLAYYWFHRASHEINIFWAAHQVHHSSEEFNLSVALRQSVVSNLGAWVFYLPMAIMGFTPAAYLIHLHFNLLFQFWIHTSLIKNLGFLELFLNTPSHHRAHHGRNPIYIDINYGGVLIIWDRLFGTFKAENDSEPAYYGLVGRLESFNAIWVQLIRLWEIGRRIRTFSTISDKISAVVKGPRWRPGLPFLGVLNRIPIREKEQHPETRYDPKVPQWMNIYAIVHFTAVLPFFFVFLRQADHWSWMQCTITAFHVTMSLANTGSVFDNRPWLGPAEVVRCGLMGLLLNYLPGAIDISSQWRIVMRFLYGLSACGWMGLNYARTGRETETIKKSL